MPPKKISKTHVKKFNFSDSYSHPENSINEYATEKNLEVISLSIVAGWSIKNWFVLVVFKELD